MRPLVVLAVLAAGAVASGCGDNVDVMITRVGDHPVAVIREVRAANGIGLQEAKLLLSGVPRGGRAPGAPPGEGRRNRRTRLRGSDPLSRALLGGLTP